MAKGLIGLGLAVVVIIGIIIIARNQINIDTAPSPSQTNLEQSDTTTTTTSTTSATTMSDTSDQKYIEYSDGVLDGASNKRRVLFFYASWCPTCRPVDQAIRDDLGLIPDDVQIIRVNYNDPQTDQSERALAQKYGVTYQHTFVQIDQNGQVVSKWNGGGLDQVLQNIK